MLPTKFRYIWPNSFRGKEFLKSANQKQESPVVAMFVNGSGQNEHSLQRTFHRCFIQSFRSFGKAVSEEKIFRNRPIRNKNCLQWPCLLMDRNEMSTHYRGPPIDASYQVSANQPIRNKSRLWRPCLLTDRDKICNEGLPQMLPTKFQFIWSSGFRGEDF